MDNTTARTLDDDLINQYAMFLPYIPPELNNDATALPCIVLAGNEDGQDGVQVYAYAENGEVVISMHFDTAGPDENGAGPWAYYGPDRSLIPVRVQGGDGRPVYVARPGIPDLSEDLVRDALIAIGTHSLAVRTGRTGDQLSAGAECARLLVQFVDITGRGNPDPVPVHRHPVTDADLDLRRPGLAEDLARLRQHGMDQPGDYTGGDDGR